MALMKPFIPALASAAEIAEQVGANVRLARIGQQLRQEDLAERSGASLQAIKNLERGGKVELLTFIRVAAALGMTEEILRSTVPPPRSLDEIERVEAARRAEQPTRVRIRG